MKPAHLIFIITMIFATNSQAQDKTIGIFSTASDVGDPVVKGSEKYDSENQIYTLKGGGYNIWFNRDEFHYLYNKIEGDFILTANFEFVGEGVDPHRKVGWMVRESLDENASHVSTTLHGDGLTVMQWRALKGAFMRSPEDELSDLKSHYTILQLERNGDKFIMRAAHWGEPLQLIGAMKMEHLGGEVLAGLFINSHNPEVLEEARIWNVRIDQPVEEDYNPYDSGFIGCRMETMNVFDGKRKVIHESDGRFEAPNWMPSGDELLFNMDGSIYTIPVNGGEIEKLNTGSANRNNNDHGISFNGKMLAISSHRDGLTGGGSSIYVLPLEGGEPKLVTEQTPSYWHGWNPNNKEVVYVAKREDDKPYNLFKADIKTGKEVQVTHFEHGHVDGPEYSPDGEYIYYNGSQSGTMQIWRMKPDGSAKEQITFGVENNWFPHISPDGLWMVYIAFSTSVAPGDHPSYKRVTLNLMAVDGGPAKVIAYMYGGQGTINVPSWSPDSKSIAFVSNSGKK